MEEVVGTRKFSRWKGKDGGSGGGGGHNVGPNHLFQVEVQEIHLLLLHLKEITGGDGQINSPTHKVVVVEVELVHWNKCSSILNYSGQGAGGAWFCIFNYRISYSLWWWWWRWTFQVVAGVLDYNAIQVLLVVEGGGGGAPGTAMQQQELLILAVVVAVDQVLIMAAETGAGGSGIVIIRYKFQ